MPPPEQGHLNLILRSGHRLLDCSEFKQVIPEALHAEEMLANRSFGEIPSTVWQSYS